MIPCVSKVYGQFIIKKELSLDNLSKSWSEYQQDTKYNLTDFSRRYFKDTISLTEMKETFYKYKVSYPKMYFDNYEGYIN